MRRLLAYTYIDRTEMNTGFGMKTLKKETVEDSEQNKLKMDLGDGRACTGLASNQKVAGCCEHDKQTCGSTKCEKLNWIKVSYLIKKGRIYCSSN
jgi:hypothetical protein